VTGRTERSGRRRDRRLLARALKVGLAVSVVVHLVLIGLYGWVFQEIEPPSADGPDPRRSWEPRMEMVPLEETPSPATAEPSVDLPARVEEPGEVDATPVEGVAAPDVGNRVATNAERLEFREGDRRLWLPPVAGPLSRLERTGAARAEEALRELLRVYLDSLALSEEQERRAREWVVRGDGDEKWGISPEGLHLGETTIPIPFGQLFSEGGEKARQARQALRDYEMIQQQSMEMEAEAVREDRLEAMRERTREALERIREEEGSDSARRDTSIDGR
jgi:hypothetical protein